MPHIRCRDSIAKLQRRDSDHQILERNYDTSASGFAVNFSRVARDVERQRIDGDIPEQIVEKSPPTIGLCRVLRSPHSVLQLDNANRRQRTAVLLAALDRRWIEIIRCFETGDLVVEVR